MSRKSRENELTETDPRDRRDWERKWREQKSNKKPAKDRRGKTPSKPTTYVKGIANRERQGKRKWLDFIGVAGEKKIIENQGLHVRSAT